jgi:hypothetical protein
MDKKQLKWKIHEYIDNMEDETALQMVHDTVVEYQRLDRSGIVDDLTPEQEKRLGEAIKQADEGKTIAHEEAMKRFNEWLYK